MMKLSFVTTNPHKFAEVKKILKDYPVEIKWERQEYDEDHEKELEDIASNAAEKLANTLEDNIIVEDTGLYFAAYKNFPGVMPK